METYRVGAGRLALRVLAVSLWRNADPGTLPVPSPWPVSRARSGSRAILVLPWALALLFALAGLTSWLHFRGAAAALLRNPPGAPLEAAALRLDRASAGIWRGLNPPACAEAAGLAATVRQGRSDLEAAARAYESAAASSRRLGPVASWESGAELLEPLRNALAAIRAPWLRDTMVYREIDAAAAASPQALPPAGRRIRGRLTAITPGHALQLRVAGPDGSFAEAGTPVLPTGASFDLPLTSGGTLHLTDLVVRDQGLFEVKEDLRVPLRDWTREPVRFPRGGTAVQVEFAGTSLLAGGFPSLSAGARQELGWPETAAGDR